MKVKCPVCQMVFDIEPSSLENEKCECPTCHSSFPYSNFIVSDEEPSLEITVPGQELPQNKQEDVPTEEEQYDGYKKCTNCGNFFYEDQHICPACGTPEQGYMFCPQCGSLLKSDIDKCPDCGMPINVSPTSKKTGKQPVKEQSINVEEPVQVPVPMEAVEEKPLPPVEEKKETPVPQIKQEPELLKEMLAEESAEPAPTKENQQPEGVVETEKEVTPEEPEKIETTIVEGQAKPIPPAPEPKEKQPVTEDVKAPRKVKKIKPKRDADVEEEEEEEDFVSPTFKNGKYVPRRPRGKKKSHKGLIIFIVLLAVIGVSSYAFLKGGGANKLTKAVNATLGLDSTSIGNIKVPTWIMGQWNGSFNATKVGSFSATISIIDDGSVVITTTSKEGKVDKELGTISSYSKESLKVLIGNDNNPIALPLDDSNRVLAIDKGLWMTKE